MTNKQTNKQYQFQCDWFSHNERYLNLIFDYLAPQRILEIGSFEGRSSVFFIEKALQYNENVELHCIDTWEGAKEHIGKWDMSKVEENFLNNIQLALEGNPHVGVVKHSSTSHQKMVELLAQGYHNYFDFIYIDGSHEAPDVLFDALLAHRLVRVGGIIAFDDYLWSPTPKMEEDHYLLVKPAVDHYVNTYQRKLRVIQGLPTFQFYVEKLQD